MGSPSPNMILAKLVFAVLSLAQARADWTGTGEVKCYGHVSTNVLTPEGGGYLSEGDVTCSPAEWVYETGLGPEAMFFHPDSGSDFEIWAWDYHDDNMPTVQCHGDIWYKKDDMGAGYCTPKKGRRASLAVALPAVLETSPVLAADQ